jgi:hypothetical protein
VIEALHVLVAKIVYCMQFHSVESPSRQTFDPRQPTQCIATSRTLVTPTRQQEQPRFPQDEATVRCQSVGSPSPQFLCCLGQGFLTQFLSAAPCFRRSILRDMRPRCPSPISQEPVAGLLLGRRARPKRTAELKHICAARILPIQSQGEISERGRYPSRKPSPPAPVSLTSPP